jgi:hypothetical protein
MTRAIVIKWTMTPMSAATMAITLGLDGGQPVNRSKTSASGALEAASSEGGTE